MLRGLGLVIPASLLLVGLSACGNSSSTLSAADNVSVDCTQAANAVGVYANGLNDLVAALAAEDPTAAAAAADAFGASAESLAQLLPGLPSEAQPFVTGSQAFAEKAKDVASAQGDLIPLTEEAKVYFATPEFIQSADAVESYFRQQCPEAVVSSN